MDIPLSPSQAARELGVATITIYKWIESGKLEHQRTQAGHKSRIWISQKAIELKKAELESAQARGEYPPISAPEEMAWANKFREVVGAMPPLYGAFRRGKVTFDEMRAETKRRVEAVL